MKIDLNDPNDFTMANVAKLLKSKDDSEHRQLRVTKAGEAFLSDEVGADNVNGLAVRFETWSAGTGYVGIEASNDTEWVQTVYKWLDENWPNPKSTYVDM